jgi:hypothetical protein
MASSLIIAPLVRDTRDYEYYLSSSSRVIENELSFEYSRYMYYVCRRTSRQFGNPRPRARTRDFRGVAEVPGSTRPKSRGFQTERKVFTGKAGGVN